MHVLIYGRSDYGTFDRERSFLNLTAIYHNVTVSSTFMN